jgi:hypothetical protein
LKDDIATKSEMSMLLQNISDITVLEFVNQFIDQIQLLILAKSKYQKKRLAFGTTDSPIKAKSCDITPEQRKDIENLPVLPPLLIGLSLPRNSPPPKSFFFARPMTESPNSFDTRENTGSENSPADLSERSENGRSFFRTTTPKLEENGNNNITFVRSSLDNSRNTLQVQNSQDGIARPRS